MYSRPIIYKIYSIFVFALSAIYFLANIVSTIYYVPENTDIDPSALTGLKVFSIFVAVVVLFFAYVNFTSMFTFAQMIQYENSNQTGPFKKLRFVFPAKFYSKFGTIITLITFILSFVYVIALIILDSVIHETFMSIPIFAIIILVVCNVLVYINIYARYKAFGDLLNLLEKSDPDPMAINNIKENKPGLLRAYCNFLYGFSIVCLVIILVYMLFNIMGLAMQIGIGSTLLIYLYLLMLWAVFFINMAVTGCFFDNHAKMLEHYMIKYNLLTNSL